MITAAALVASFTTGAEGSRGAGGAGIKGAEGGDSGSEMGGKLKPDRPLERVVRFGGRDIGGIIVGWRGEAIEGRSPGFIIAVVNVGIDTFGNPGIDIGVVRGGSDDKLGIFGKAVGGGRVDVDPGGNVKGTSPGIPAPASVEFKTGIVGTPVFKEMFAIPSAKLGLEVKETSEKPSTLFVVVSVDGIIGISFCSVGN